MAQGLSLLIIKVLCSKGGNLDKVWKSHFRMRDMARGPEMLRVSLPFMNLGGNPEAVYLFRPDLVEAVLRQVKWHFSPELFGIGSSETV